MSALMRWPILPPPSGWACTMSAEQQWTAAEQEVQP